MSRKVLVDGRNVFDPEIARQAGFDYTGIGRGVAVSVMPVPVA